jgi:hypothetical protein
VRKVLRLALLASTIPSLAADPAPAQAPVEVPRTEKIPKGFKTYSLFLVCNPEWLDAEKAEGLYKLYLQFQNFGRAIGEDHLAVWFWKALSPVGDRDLAKNVDVERSIRFCQAWKLKPSAGPHLVVSSTYPDESELSAGLPKNSAVFELGKMAPKDISSLLAGITDELVERGRLDHPATPSEAPAGLWVRLLEAAQRTINTFGCAWSFKVEAGAVSADLHSCQRP